MNVSKPLAAAIAAATVVGAVGFAFAQSSSETPASPAYPKASGDLATPPLNPSTTGAQAPLVAPADPNAAVIAPAETQKAAAQDPSMQAPVEGSKGTQSGAAPAPDKSLSTTPTPAPVTTDSAMISEPAPKADRN